MSIRNIDILASVCTLVKGRELHLTNMLRGLSFQAELRFEVIIASMQQAPIQLPAGLPFQVRIVQVDVPGDALPLAAARNLAALDARADTLIFLDVDCIPYPQLVASYVQQVRESARCLMGEVRYLPASAEVLLHNEAALARLVTLAIVHPARPAPPSTGWRDEPSHKALWGLSFALPRQSYIAADGMDENYRGWGGEETDFAERLFVTGVKLGWSSDALALHQYHAVFMPPLDKFHDVVRNASYFYERWGSWCLEYWLEQFAELGFIRWQIDCKSIEVIAVPSHTQIEDTRQPPEVAFS